MKKSTLNLVTNVATMGVGLAITALSQNKNLYRRMEAINSASREVSRQIHAEKIIDKAGYDLQKGFEKDLLTGEFEAGSMKKMDYSKFFMLRIAAYSVLENQDSTVYTGKYYNEAGTAFRCTERFISSGKLFLFIADVDSKNKELYDGGAERRMSYRRILQSNDNLKGTVFVFDVDCLTKAGHDPLEYGEYLVTAWEVQKEEAAI